MPTCTVWKRPNGATTASSVRSSSSYSFPPELGQWACRVASERWPSAHDHRGLQPAHPSRPRLRDRGDSPHVAKADLWQTSGHLDFYAEGMYPGMVLDESTEYRLKPMNCPFHILIFGSRGRSYRELPLRLFELGTVYRYERSGVVHGLLRARGFTQDDSHIFIEESDIAEELQNLLDFTLMVLRDFGFTEFEADLSTRPGEVHR